MLTMLKKILIATLVVSLPALAEAADPAPTPVVGAKSATTATETPQKSPTAAATESTPSNNAAVRQTTKIGFVDMPYVFSNSVRGKAAETKLKGMKDKLQARADAKRKQLEKQRVSLEAKLPTLSQEERKSKAKEFQKKVEDFQKFGKQLEEELYATQEKETKGLFDATEQAAVAYGKANGFAVIVIKKELLYVGDNIDAQNVTDALIKAMDEADRKK